MDYDFGPINGLLHSLGQTNIMPSLAWINTWRYTGFVTLLFFAGLQAVPKELKESNQPNEIKHGKIKHRKIAQDSRSH